MSRVFVKNRLNGVIYVYESVGYWDRQKKQARNKPKCIGKLDPKPGEIIPSHKIDLTKLISAVKKRGPQPAAFLWSHLSIRCHWREIGSDPGSTDLFSRYLPANLIPGLLLGSGGS